MKYEIIPVPGELLKHKVKWEDGTETIYANRGSAEHWAMVKTGEKEHNRRGRDLKPRAERAKLDFAAKLKQYYDLDVNRMVVQQKSAVDTLYARAAKADEEGDVERADELLEKAAAKGNQLLGILMPYVAPKRGTVNEDLDASDILTLDDLLAGKDEG